MRTKQHHGRVRELSPAEVDGLYREYVFSAIEAGTYQVRTYPQSDAYHTAPNRPELLAHCGCRALVHWYDAADHVVLCQGSGARFS